MTVQFVEAASVNNTIDLVVKMAFNIMFKIERESNNAEV
jgi:hypothetical protein